MNEASQVLGAISASDSEAIERVYVVNGGLGADLAILGAGAAMLMFGRDTVQRALRRANGKLAAWNAELKKATPSPA